MEFVWVLIPLAGIAVGAYEMYLKARTEQRRLGTTTHELEGEVTSLKTTLQASETERRALAERVQNLETIVTSRLWGAVRDPETTAATTSDPEKRRRLAELEMTLADLPKDEPTPAEKAARLAGELEI